MSGAGRAEFSQHAFTCALYQIVVQLLVAGEFGNLNLQPAVEIVEFRLAVPLGVCFVEHVIPLSLPGPIALVLVYIPKIRPRSQRVLYTVFSYTGRPLYPTPT